MSSPSSLPRVSSFRRRSSFLVLQDDPMPLTSKGQGSLSMCIRSPSRSGETRSVLGPVRFCSMSHLGEAEVSGGLRGLPSWYPATAIDPLSSWRDFSLTSLLTVALIQGRLTDEAEPSGHEPSLRRPSSVFDTPQMRSMRLIGNSNPRYRVRVLLGSLATRSSLGGPL